MLPRQTVRRAKALLGLGARDKESVRRGWVQIGRLGSEAVVLIGRMPFDCSRLIKGSENQFESRRPTETAGVNDTCIRIIKLSRLPFTKRKEIGG